jgi:hypothetical protein
MKRRCEMKDIPVKFVKCNCVTKTPEGQHHKKTCPVWWAYNGCEVNKFSSRVCEDGTKGCEVYHL